MPLPPYGQLVVCRHCDAVHRQVPLSPGEKARCLRCGAVLYRQPRLRADQMLALVVTALVAFAVANAFPIVELGVQGMRSHTTLLGSVAALWAEGRRLVAVLVFVTTMVAPLLDLGLMLTVLSAAALGRPSRSYAALLRLLQSLRPWGMLEIFMLGILVSLVKLSHLAHVVPGVALWAFACLTVLLAILVSWDLGSLWTDGADEDAA